MKTIRPILLIFALSGLGTLNLNAGTIFYQAISATQSDTSCGINDNNQYTSAVDGGNRRGTDRVINGITLYSLVGNEQSATADNCTLNALAGSLSNAGGTSGSVQADGTFKEVLSDMTFNNGAGDGSEQEIVLDPESLEAGATYDLRIYICNFAGQNRQVNLAFVGDGQAPVETGVFNEDDARSSGGGFSDQNQVYYINYRYVWDGESNPGVTVTQKAGNAPFVLYALTNQIVPGGASAAEGPPAPEAPEASGITTGMIAAQSDDVGVQSDDFYTDESLNNNGRWISIAEYGRCWVPGNCPGGWRPYTNGSWRYSDDEGWVFVSDEPWAWACYHYGRWIQVEFGCGWAWVPGTDWSGGWVSWRRGSDASCDCVAWAPLPPEVKVDYDVGVSTWVDETYDIGPEAYVFVNVGDFIDGNFFGGDVIYDFDRTINVFNHTVNITNVSVTNINVTNVTNVNIYNGGPDYGWIHNQANKEGKDFGKILIDRKGDIGGFEHGHHSKFDGKNLAIHSPNVRADGKSKHPPKTDTHLSANKVNHGWKGVNKNAKNQIKNHIAQENKGRTPKNTKATVPSNLTKKAGATGRHPGKGPKGPGTGPKSTAGGHHAAGSLGQHPGKGKTKSQGQLKAAKGTGAGGGFNQHPGKGKQKGAGAAGPSKQAGGGKHMHPGKLEKKRTTGAGAGAGPSRTTAGAAGKGRSKGAKHASAGAGRLTGPKATHAGGGHVKSAGKNRKQANAGGGKFAGPKHTTRSSGGKQRSKATQQTRRSTNRSQTAGGGRVSKNRVKQQQRSHNAGPGPAKRSAGAGGAGGGRRKQQQIQAPRTGGGSGGGRHAGGGGGGGGGKAKKRGATPPPH
jgi:Family of unknown function (DUF6600)